jgi:HSP20 family protein
LKRRHLKRLLSKRVKGIGEPDVFIRLDFTNSGSNNIYDQFFKPDFLPSTFLFGKGKWTPRLDISEGKKDITVKVEVPGIETKDFDISLDRRTLTIKGHKDDKQEEKEETYYRVERSYGYFSRTIELPAEVDLNKVEANYKRGILKIKLRKTKSSETKRIHLTTGR